MTANKYVGIQDPASLNNWATTNGGTRKSVLGMAQVEV
jgi:hypothetical protein